MNIRVVIVIAFVMIAAGFTGALKAESLEPTVNESVEMSYKETILLLNHHMSKNWNKRATYFDDGITYSAEVNQNEAIFRVRRYNPDYPKLNPFLIVKIVKEPDSRSRVEAWEGDYAYETYKNLSRQIKFWLKNCKGGCKLPD